MMHLLKNLAQSAKKAEGSTESLFKRLIKNPPHDLDDVVGSIHEEVFRETDCLLCANCCRDLGPRITDRDIDRMSKYLKLKPSAFTLKYLRIDEDGDYIFREMPCPFLADDNRCRIYEVRPKACREYPHTDRRKFHQLFDITLKNSFICPAVYQIVEELKVYYKKI